MILISMAAVTLVHAGREVMAACWTGSPGMVKYACRYGDLGVGALYTALGEAYEAMRSIWPTLDYKCRGGTCLRYV